MPRISKQLSDAKQEFVLSILTTNPTLTVREVQEQLKVKFADIKGGASMNPRTILDLRNGILNPQTSPIVTLESADSTESIVTPEPVGSTEGIVTSLPVPDVQVAVGPEAVDEVLRDNPPPTPPSPVVQVAAPAPKPVIVPVEGETYRVVTVTQVTDDTGTYIKRDSFKTE